MKSAVRVMFRRRGLCARRSCPAPTAAEAKSDTMSTQRSLEGCIADLINAQIAVNAAHARFQDVVTQLAMDVKEAARLLRVAPDTIYKLIYAGRLKTVRVGRRQLVRRESVLELLADFAAETAAA